jgi:lysophospholipase
VSDRVLAGSRHGERVFDPDATRAQLRPLEFSGLSVASTEEHDYFAFYGLDFASRIAGVVHHFGSLEAAGFTIACHFYTVPEPRGTCVLLHGYFDHAGLYGHLIEHCLRRGYSVLIWDLPGHGLSSGERASIHSFAHYVDVLGAVLERHAAVLPRPWVGIGQSTGAAVLLGWALRREHDPSGCPFSRQVLLAPLVRPAEWHKVRFSYHLLRPFRRSIRRVFMANSGDAAFLAFVQRDPLQSRELPVRWVGAMRAWVHEFLAHAPTAFAPVVIQGDADGTVDWTWNLERIRERFPGAQVTMIRGARHHLVNETAALREQVFAGMGI